MYRRSNTKERCQVILKPFQTVVDNIRNIPYAIPHKTTHTFPGYVHSWLEKLV